MKSIVYVYSPKKKNETNINELDPFSCNDLYHFGHTLNGIYLIKNKLKQKVEAVHCNFQPPTGHLRE